MSLLIGSRRHGGPIRLIVPGWYGMASVKWVAAIETDVVGRFDAILAEVRQWSPQAG